VVTSGDDVSDTRRRISRDELDVDSRTSQVIDRLATDRLLTVDERGVQLVHETLLRAWPRLRDWIDESRAAREADGVIRVWSANDLGARLAQTSAQGGRANKVVFTSAGDLVAAYNDGKVRFWRDDGSERRPARKVDSDGDAVFSVAVSPTRICSRRPPLRRGVANGGVTERGCLLGKRGRHRRPTRRARSQAGL
jgi:hypothetical protein